MKKQVAIVHYNTPEITEAAIWSLRKHGGEDYEVFVFDNSDERPFTAKMKGVTVFDNTKGQIIDFEKELAKYPDKSPDIGCQKSCVYGSDKHMMTVQYIMDHVLTDGFLLMDSDILIRQSVDFMFMQDECVCGHITSSTSKFAYPRLAPMLLWINSKMCREGGAVFFDPERSWALHGGNFENPKNGWDTGAALLEDIKTKKPQCHGKRIDIRPLIWHYVSGSWFRNDLGAQRQWLNEHRDLWYTEPEPREAKYTVMTYIFGGYEFPHEVMEKDPDAEYLLITDDKNLKSATWQVIYDPSLAGRNPIESNYDVRLHPFRYAHTDVVVRIDGSIELKKSLAPLLKAFNDGGYDRCLMIHPQRNTLPSEYDVWVKTRGYPRSQADKCMVALKRMGYDLEQKGLYQGCFEVQRDNRTNNAINDLVFGLHCLMGTGSIERIDQTITSAIINRFYSNLKVLPVSEDIITDGNLMQWYFHNSDRPIPQKTDLIAPIFCGKPVTCFYPNSKKE